MLGITVPMNRCPLLLIIVSSLLSAWGNVIYEGLCNPAHKLNNINVHRQYVERSTKRVSLINICENNGFNNISNVDAGFYYLNLYLLTEIQQHKHFFSFTMRMPFCIFQTCWAELNLMQMSSKAMRWLPMSAESDPPPDTTEKILKKKILWTNFNQNTLIYNSQMYYFLSI